MRRENSNQEGKIVTKNYDSKWDVFIQKPNFQTVRLEEVILKVKQRKI